jgi:4-hydroxythreonine-4-phosphate dehydrogenase
MTAPRPVVGITMGDPVGIGPEIVLKALDDAALYEKCRPLIFGDAQWLGAVARNLGSILRLNPVAAPAHGIFCVGDVDIVSVSDLPPGTIRWGKPTVQTGRAMVDYILRAVDEAVTGVLDAVVTCPINKKAMMTAGFDFPGHTELIARHTGASEVGMMLAGERLRVVLVTIHTAINRVPALLSEERVLSTILLADRSLKERFGIVRPRLAVAALNPHAGEEGMFGDEEERVIMPAISRAEASGVLATGPHPPDTVFYQAVRGMYDAVICMYHDQGLIPFKLLHFEDGVNTTLGLPIIRTSVDHGTAYDIAGTGRADPGSLKAAIYMAAEQARNMGSLKRSIPTPET